MQIKHFNQTKELGCKVTHLLSQFCGLRWSMVYSHRLPCQNFRQELLIYSFLEEITEVPAGIYGFIREIQVTWRYSNYFH